MFDQQLEPRTGKLMLINPKEEQLAVFKATSATWLEGVICISSPVSCDRYGTVLLLGCFYEVLWINWLRIQAIEYGHALYALQRTILYMTKPCYIQLHYFITKNIVTLW